MSRGWCVARASRALAALVTLAGVCLVPLLAAAPVRAAPPAVLERGYDANGTNANLSETTLNTSNISVNTFGLVFSLPVDDEVYAQPLYVPNLTISGGTHNVVYVATMSDTVFAFDADTGAQLWSKSLLTAAGATPVPIANYAYEGSKNIVGNLGILSTPVIDPSTNTLYAVTATQENATIVYRLHALDITTGALRANSGVPISGSYLGFTFDGRQQWQRLSLVLVGNNVIFGFGALEEEYSGGYTGWMMTYDKTSLAQTGVLATVASGTSNGGGLWQSGRPPVIDSSGYLYVFTGNSFGGSNGYDGVNNFSETVLKLDPSNGLAIKDWFTPFNWQTMDSGDKDLTASGPTLIPGTSLLVGGGKTGVFYLLNTGNLGHESSTDAGAIQELTVGSGQPMRGGPVWWQRSVGAGGPLMYNWSVGDSLKAWTFNGSTFATTPVASGPTGAQIYPGGILTLSANGETAGTGVIWASIATSGNADDDPPVPGELHAYDASDLNELWNSTQNASRDSLGNLAKFTPPLVVNGRVYMATASNTVAVYGLLQTPAATPTFSPAPGTYSPGQAVTLSDSTSGAAIHYTLDGSPPSASSAIYTQPITLSSTTTINAIAVASGYANSAVASGTYTITGGSGGGPIAVNVASEANVDGIANNGTAVTGGGLDGGGFAYSETLLGSSIVWNGNTYSLLAAGVPDAVTSATITLPAGSYTTISLLGTAVNGAQPGQTFTVHYSDGTTSTFTQSMSDWYTPQNYTGESQALKMPYRVEPNGSLDNRPFYLYGYSFAVNSAKTVTSITLPANTNVVILAIDVLSSGTSPPPPTAATPTFSPAAGTYSPGQTVTLSDSTSGAAIHYTLDGSQPSASSTLYSQPIALSSGSTTTINAIAVASGYTNSAVASATYTVTSGGGGGGGTPGAVNLSSEANVDGIANNGTAVTGGGLDGGDYAYSETLLGSSVAWNGNSYSFLAAGVPDAVTSATIALPAGNYTTISLLGTAVNGAQPGQTFIVHYSDGTTSTFTQSMSDWHTPQNYSGESQAVPMAYRVEPNGSLDNRPFYLYGYSFTVNSAKTVTSIVLPANTNVIILAIDVLSSGTSPPPPTAATPTFSPAAGTYSPGQTVTLSDSTSGASIYYTLDGSPPGASSTLYTQPIALSSGSTTTVNAIAIASGYTNSAVASATYTVTSGGGGGGAPGEVNVSSAANVDGIANNGTAVTGGGLDGGGYAYSETLLGSSVVWNGNTYALLSAGVPDAVTSATITLPAGSYTTISLLGTAVNGAQPGQTFTVHYSDGSTSTFTQSMSDWHTPQNYTGESQAVQMAYRVEPNGSLDNRPFYLYGYSFAVNSAKTVTSITLPANTNVIILAIDVLSSGTSPPPPTAATPTFSPAAGTYSPGQTVTLSDSTSGAAIHYTLDGSQPSASSTLYSQPIALSSGSTTTINAIAIASGYTNSAVASATYTVTSGGGGGGTPGAVNLSSEANVDGIANNGTAVTGGGLDGGDYAYSETLLGSSVAWNGNTYSFLAAGVPDAVTSATIALPAGNYSTISLLGTAVNSAQLTQTFTVHYSDGTTSTFTQNMSDWFTPENYSGESQALKMAYRVQPDGSLDNRPFYLYGYSFTLNSAKTATSITLPADSDVIILAIDVH